MSRELPEPVMLDSNVPMYAAGREHPYRVPCQQVLKWASAGEMEAVSNAEVHQEILHRYHALGLGARAREVSEDFQTLVPRVLIITMADVARARDLMGQYSDLSARDLLHVAVMLNNGIGTIVSADRHFDQVSQVHRLDPVDLASAPAS